MLAPIAFAFLIILSVTPVARAAAAKEAINEAVNKCAIELVGLPTVESPTVESPTVELPTVKSPIIVPPQAKIDSAIVTAFPPAFAATMPKLNNAAEIAGARLFSRLLPNLILAKYATPIEAASATNRLRLLLNEAVNLPFNRASNGDANKRDLYFTITREAGYLGGFRRLWDRVGLGDAYETVFRHDDRRFWNSALTLLSIYRLLYKTATKNTYANLLEKEHVERSRGSAATVRALTFLPGSGLSGRLLMVEDARRLPPGQVVWQTNGESAIVGPDNAQIEQSPWAWGVSASAQLDLAGLSLVSP